MQITKSLKIGNQQSQELYKTLISKGYVIKNVSNPYVVWACEGNDTVVMFYTSGSLVIQGKEDVSSLLNLLNGEFSEHIGSDEVGKGDYYGPLVICSVFLNKSTYNQVSSLGITDSKKLTDTKIMEIFNQLKDITKFECEILTPSLYNKEIKKFKNVSYMLANLHAKCVEKLLTRLEKGKYICVVDQFSANKDRLASAFKKVNVTLEQYHKGESDIVVALASIFARAVFLQEWEKMNDNYKLTFPKGANDVISFGKEFVKKFGTDELENVAKISFRTTSQILSPF